MTGMARSAHDLMVRCMQSTRNHLCDWGGRTVPFCTAFRKRFFSAASSPKASNGAYGYVFVSCKPLLRMDCLRQVDGGPSTDTDGQRNAAVPRPTRAGCTDADEYEMPASGSSTNLCDSRMLVDPIQCGMSLLCTHGCTRTPMALYECNRQRCQYAAMTTDNSHN